MVTEDDVITAIRKVYDPEIPVSIYELGLIYGIDVEPSGTVRVRMTLTAPNCPAAQSLPAEVARRVEEIPDVTSAKVEIVFDPPWDRSMMSEAAQLELGLIHLF
jgi:FeS assembly SUF system protein